MTPRQSYTTKLQKKIKMLEKIKIDSFKLRVPRVNVNFVDPKFSAKYQKLYSDTGEIDEHINLDKHKVDITKGITTRIGVVHSMDAKGGGEYVVFQINAKMLKNKYFQGINRQNIKNIYKFLMSFNLVFVEYKVFLDGLISDIDLCFDFNITREAMVETNQKIYENVLPYCYKYVSKPFRKKTNTGLQFNDRSKSTPSKPYCKIYHKTTELETKSEEFANHFLKNTDYQNIGRFEYTMAQEIIKEYKDLSPTDRLLLEFINRLISRGSDKHNIYTALNIFDIPQEKSRMKKKLFQLLEKVNDKHQLIANQESMQMLRVLRLDL